MKTPKKRSGASVASCALAVALVFGIIAFPAFASADGADTEQAKMAALEEEPGSDCSTDNTAEEPEESTDWVTDADGASLPKAPEKSENLFDAFVTAATGELQLMQLNATDDTEISTDEEGVQSFSIERTPHFLPKAYEKLNIFGKKVWLGPYADSDIPAGVTIQLRGYVDWEDDGLDDDDRAIFDKMVTENSDGTLSSKWEDYKFVEPGSYVDNKEFTVHAFSVAEFEALEAGNEDVQHQEATEADIFYDTNENGAIDHNVIKVGSDFSRENIAKNRLSIPFVVDSRIAQDGDWTYNFDVLEKWYYEYKPVMKEKVGEDGKVVMEDGEPVLEPTGTYKLATKADGSLIRHRYIYEIDEIDVDGFTKTITQPMDDHGEYVASETDKFWAEGDTDVLSSGVGNTFKSPGSLIIEKTYTDKIWANGYVDEEGKQQTDTNNNVTVIFKIEKDDDGDADTDTDRTLVGYRALKFDPSTETK